MVKPARIVENIIYLTALILGVPLFLALYRALRSTSLAPALFGSVLGILGLAVMIVGATPHVAHALLSNLYHTPGATSADQMTLTLLWQAIRGVFDAILYVGFFVVPIGLLVLGVAMLGASTFGKGFGWLSVGLGAVGLTAAVFQLVDHSSMIGAGTFLAIIIFYIVLGSKVYRLSKVPSES